MNNTMPEKAQILPSDQEFIAFQKLILDKIGIFLPLSKKALLMNRLWKRLCAHQLNNYHDYYCFIVSKKGGHELNLALELITTNETYFFREQKHFDYLANDILPQIKSRDMFRVWSAAASTGEEPYSIAMLLAERCVASWDLLCSDVNSQVIEQAKIGIYPQLRAKNIPQNYLRRFCRKGNGPQEGFIRVVAELRERVEFFTLNLNSPIARDMGLFDVVFLRNILIYFENDTKEQVLSRVAKTLKPNGILFIGHSESLHGVTNKFLPVKPAIYRLA
ncbi:MAG TPA: CheR family methyltransferase [Cellvibrionaceae bacterium]